MSKKLAIAALFAASTLIGVQPANASTGACVAKYQQDLIACQGDQTCETNADIALVQCLQALYDHRDPLEP